MRINFRKANTLRNLKLEEFSLVRGDHLQPANPESKAAFYKAAPIEGDDMRIRKTTEKPAPPPAKESLAKQIAAAVKTAIEKATTTRTSEYSSSGKSTETWTETSDPAQQANEPTVIVVTDAVEKTQPTQQPTAQPAAEPGAGQVVKTEVVEGLSQALTEALAPITKAIVSFDSRLVKVEKTPVGSRVLKATPGLVVTDTSEQKFPDFTKFLASKSGLTSGQKLSKATITSGGWSYGLSVHEASAFIDYIVDQQVLLKQIRTVKMPDKKYFIDKIGLGGKVLVKGTPGTDPGDTVSLSGPTQVALDAAEVLAIVSIGDDTVEDNIEGEAFVQHLLGMIGRAAGNELEEASVHGDTSVGDAGILDRFDGFYKIAKANGAHVIEAMTDADRFWPGTAAKKATKVIKSIPTKFRQDTRTMGCILAPDAYLDYNDKLAELGYANAWASITGIQDVPIRSIRNVQVPMLKTNMGFTYSSTPYTDGTFVMFTDLRNLIFGIHREIRIEPFRQPRKRCTDYVLSMRCAVNIENGDAIGIYDHAKIAA